LSSSTAWVQGQQPMEGKPWATKRMGRELMALHIGVKLGLSPIGQGIELQLVIGGFNHRQADTIPPWNRLRPVIQAS